MGIDDIKPLGGNSSSPDPNAETPVESRRENSFVEAKGKLPASDAAEIPGTVSGTLAQFGRAALGDPAKLDEMVRASVSDLIDAGQIVTGQLTGAQKQSLTDFLSGDPLMRQQIETYLRKVLV
jgi:hypothetical protein